MGFLTHGYTAQDLKRYLLKGGEVFYYECAKGDLVAYLISLPKDIFLEKYQGIDIRKTLQGEMFGENIFKKNEIYYLDQIAIDPLYAGKGIGEALLKKYLSKKRFKYIFTSTYLYPYENVRSLIFFLKNKFKIFSEIRWKKSVNNKLRSSSATLLVLKGLSS